MFKTDVAQSENYSEVSPLIEDANGKLIETPYFVVTLKDGQTATFADQSYAFKWVKARLGFTRLSIPAGSNVIVYDNNVFKSKIEFIEWVLSNREQEGKNV